MDTSEAVAISAFFGTILMVAVGVTWNALDETSAIETMVKSGESPIDAACAMGDVTACQTAERIRAYALR